MKKMTQAIRKEWDLMPELEMRSVKAKKQFSMQNPKEPINEYSSLRWTQQ